MNDVFSENALIMKENENDAGAQFLSNYKFINLRSQKDEKSIKASLLNLNAALSGDSGIFSLFQNYEQLRGNEKTLLRNQMKEIKQSISYLHHLQTCSQTESQKKDIRNVISAVRDFVKSDIFNFKEHEEVILFKLAEEEHGLCRELEDISRNMPLFTKQGNKKYSSKAAYCNLPFEVTEFQDFVEKNNGHLGGWDEKDHYLFLKLRAKYKENRKFLSEVSKAIAHLEESEIKCHELWYVEYLTKKERKDSAIFQWKQEQQVKKQKNCEMENSRSRDTHQHLSSAQHKQKMLKLQAWKQECMMLKKKESIERNSLKKAQEESAKQKFLDHQREVKNKLKKYKEQKSNQGSRELSSSLSIASKYSEQQVVKKFIKILQMRDELSFMKKKEKIMVQELKDFEKELKLKSRVKVVVPYDPDRLLKPTQASIQRKQVGSKDFEQPMFLPRRATPMWRKDIS